MARISGVDLPNKHVNIALTYIYGISHSSAKAICEKSKIDPMRMINDLNQDELAAIRAVIDQDYKVEGRLRTESRSSAAKGFARPRTTYKNQFPYSQR